MSSKSTDVSAVMPAGDLSAKIATFRSTAREMHAEAYDLAVACLARVEHHGDADGVRDLIAAMPSSVKRQPLIRWFTAACPAIKVSLGKDEHGKVSVSVKCKGWQTAAGNASVVEIHPYDYERAKKERDQTSSEQLIARMEKAAENANDTLTPEAARVAAAGAAAMAAALKTIRAEMHRAEVEAAARAMLADGKLATVGDAVQAAPRDAKYDQRVSIPGITS